MFVLFSNIMMLFTEMMKIDPKMLPLEISSKFYLTDKNLPKDVRKAWFIFAYNFLPCVNGEWLKCLSPAKAKQRTNMFRFISVSDEAYTRWLLEIKYNKVLDDINSTDTENKDKKFEKPKGAHDSCKFMHRYCAIYNEVDSGRTVETQTIYNNWFWTYYEKSYPAIFQDNSIITREMSTEAYIESRPDFDKDKLELSLNIITKTYNDIDNEDEDNFQNIQKIDV